MLTAICCIAKFENWYLEEWADYHLSLGFDHIYLYDNNDPAGERIISSVSENERVTVIDCRGKTAYQNVAYTDFYKRFGKAYDWIAYIDVDEFITFSEESGLRSIKDFLSRFDSQVDIVHLNWMCYGDDDIVDLDEDRSVIRRFKNPLPFDLQIQYDFPENNHVKSIIRGGMDIGERMITVHTPKDGDFRVVDAEGRPCKNDYFKPYDFSTAYIRHYVTKTIYEWLIKISKGIATSNAASELYSIDRFFLYNDRTSGKDKVIHDYLLFKEAIGLSVNTDLAICRAELQNLRKENARLKSQFQEVSHSKAFKLLRFIKNPVKALRKKPC